MDLQRWEQVCDAFDQIVGLGEAQRRPRLEAIGTSDPELRGAIEALLSADSSAEALLERIESALGSPPHIGVQGANAPAEDIRARLQAALGDAYRIDREIGGGGMSYVFLAHDRALQRKVVVKVLRPDLMEAISAKRFQREILFLARLQHPHIIPLLSGGGAGRLLYYVMPFVDGETLRERLRRERELPIDEVVRILRDIASALAHAHRRDVDHRDVKPESVLLSDGGAVVADFGIAKALGDSSTARDKDGLRTSTLTARGLALGTPLYMAPEQAAGASETDHRADLYALGALTYEMLAGKPPFHGRSPQQLLAAHALERPAPITGNRPRTPPWLATLVMQCLEKRPDDRPRDASELLRAIDESQMPRDVASASESRRNSS